MSQTHLEVTYRQGQAFAAYLRLPRPRGAKVAATREVTPSILADVDASGQLLGLRCRRCWRSFTLRALRTAI